METEIVVHTKDDVGPDADNLYCAIVMRRHAGTRFNSGLVVREDTPEKAFAAALAKAIKVGVWR